MKFAIKIFLNPNIESKEVQQCPCKNTVNYILVTKLLRQIEKISHFQIKYKHIKNDSCLKFSCIQYLKCIVFFLKIFIWHKKKNLKIFFIFYFCHHPHLILFPSIRASVNSSSDTHLSTNGIPFTRMTIPSREEMDSLFYKVTIERENGWWIAKFHHGIWLSILCTFFIMKCKNR